MNCLGKQRRCKARAGLAILLASPALARAAQGAVDEQVMSWDWIIRTGRWPMIVLAGLSVVTVAFVLYFFAVLRVKPIASPVLLRDLLEKLRTGELDEARRVCEYRPCPLSAIVLAALHHRRSVSNLDPVLLKDVVEGEGQRQAGSIQGQIQYLQDVALVSPMIGLLGTVLGMLRAFSSIALDIAHARPIMLAEGVSQALVTTAFGLIVGIVAMMFHAYFRRRASNLIYRLEQASTEALAALSDGGGRDAGMEWA